LFFSFIKSNLIQSFELFFNLTNAGIILYIKQKVHNQHGYANTPANLLLRLWQKFFKQEFYSLALIVFRMINSLKVIRTKISISRIRSFIAASYTTLASKITRNTSSQFRKTIVFLGAFFFIYLIGNFLIYKYSSSPDESGLFFNLLIFFVFVASIFAISLYFIIKLIIKIIIKIIKTIILISKIRNLEILITKKGLTFIISVISEDKKGRK